MTPIAEILSKVKELRLKVKVYTKGRMHAKAYIFDYCTLFDNAGKSDIAGILKLFPVKQKDFNVAEILREGNCQCMK